MTDLTRLEELVARYATEGLSATETMEMRRLLETEPDWDPDMDVEEFELAAAAIDLAMTPAEEPIPEAVRERVLAHVQQEVEAQPDTASEPPPVLTGRRDASGSKPSWTSQALPWLAAAAALLIAVVGWWPRQSTPTEIVATDSETRARLAATSGTLVRGWTATEDPAAVGTAAGDVVWSDAEQRGYMRISGLAVNDPTSEQYQLWIFDRGRDERYPVDGGVFDMPAGVDEVLVPIDAKLPIDEPYLFAVTVEPPGGVVVSSRERIALVAEV